MRKKISSSALVDDVDLDASYYVRNSLLQNSLAKKILSNYRLKRSAHILDVGCGDGRITAELAHYANKGKVIGLDASVSMIEFASHNFPKHKFPNLSFQHGKAEDVNFCQQFDLIVSFSCFQWFRDPKKAIRRLSSALKINGEMLVLTYPKESPYYRYLQTALKNYPEYHDLSANKTMLSTNDYKKTLHKNDLDIISFRQQKLFATYNTYEEIKQYIRGWLSNYIQLPEYLNDVFIKDVIQAIINDSTTHKGKKIRIPYTALVIKARKK
ncbi:MAG: class I SAM-dependent methyltransferase [Nitrososphaeraceae archaeon]